MRKSRRERTLFITNAAIIAALYVVLTFISSLAGLDKLVPQLRLSEMLIATAAFTPAAIPGLFIGCLISNLTTGAMIWDIILGSLATLVGAWLGYLLRRHRYLFTLPTLIANTLVISPMLCYVYGIELSLPVAALAVFAGELISATVLGTLLYSVLKRYKNQIFQ